MEILDTLGDFGQGILGTLGQGIDAFGTNISAQATANQAQAQALLARTQIAQEAALREQARKDKQAEVFRTVMYSLVAMGGISLLFFMAMQYQKSK